MRLSLMCIISIFFLLPDKFINAQDEWVEAVLITQKGDTIYGSVKVRDKPSKHSIPFKSGDFFKVFDADELLLYRTSEGTFRSYLIGGQYQFFHLVEDGRVKLLNQGKKLFLQKLKQKPRRISRFNVKNLLREYVYENDSLLGLLKSDRHILLGEVHDLILFYNKWYSENENVLKAQNLENLATKQNIFSIKLNLSGAGVGGELKIADPLTFYLEGGAGVFAYLGSNGSAFKFYPYVKGQVRYFPFIIQEGKDGKRVSKFSSFYGGMLGIYQAGETTKNDVAGTGVCFGYQSTLSRNIYWGIDMGAGVNLSHDTSEPFIYVGFSFGVIF